MGLYCSEIQATLQRACERIVGALREAEADVICGGGTVQFVARGKRFEAHRNAAQDPQCAWPKDGQPLQLDVARKQRCASLVDHGVNPGHNHDGGLGEQFG